MARSVRSAVFLCGLAMILGGVTAISSNDAVVLGLVSVGLGALLLTRSDVARPFRVAAGIVLLGLAAAVLVVAAPSPVDWPMVGVATAALAGAATLLLSRGRPWGEPPAGRV